MVCRASCVRWPASSGIAQSRMATNGDAELPPLAELPLSVPELAALATDARFHLT